MYRGGEASRVNGYSRGHSSYSVQNYSGVLLYGAQNSVSVLHPSPREFPLYERFYLVFNILEGLERGSIGSSPRRAPTPFSLSREGR